MKEEAWRLFERLPGFKWKTRNEFEEEFGRKVRNVLGNSRGEQEKAVQKWSSEIQRAIQREKRRREARGENDNGTRRFQLPKTTNMGGVLLVMRRCMSSLCQSIVVDVIWLEWRQKLVVQMLANTTHQEVSQTLYSQTAGRNRRTKLCSDSGVSFVREMEEGTWMGSMMVWIWVPHTLFEQAKAKATLVLAVNACVAEDAPRFLSSQCLWDWKSTLCSYGYIVLRFGRFVGFFHEMHMKVCFWMKSVRSPFLGVFAKGLPWLWLVDFTRANC